MINFVKTTTVIELIGLCFIILLLPVSAFADRQTVAGWIEHGKLLPEDICFNAKLDTGALTASLHAINIEYFERGNQQWVRFDILINDENYHMEREVVRTVRIKQRIESLQSPNNSSVIERPVVNIDLELGGQLHTIGVGLTNRGNLEYPLLLGRRALITFALLVDASKQDLLPMTREFGCID